MSNLFSVIKRELSTLISLTKEKNKINESKRVGIVILDLVKWGRLRHEVFGVGVQSWVGIKFPRHIIGFSLVYSSK